MLICYFLFVYIVYAKLMIMTGPAPFTSDPILIKLCILTLGAFFLFSCSRSHYTVIDFEDESYYSSHTHSQHIKNEIENSFRSVKRIQSTVFYRTYKFDLENLPLESELYGANLEEISVGTSSDNHSTAGTAVVLSQSRSRLGLLTASHIVTSPDTIWHHAFDVPNQPNSPVEAVSVKERVSYYIFGAEEIGSFELVINDSRRDLALLTTRMGTGRNSDIRPLSIPAGNMDHLDWADLVYAVGYPKGVQMVTSGIVSKMNIPRRSGFVVDASFNRGFSGGIVFAARSDGSGLEWIGMMTSASADIEYMLAPEYITEDEYNPDIPYSGPMFVRRIPRINYGITYAVDISEVQNFFSENEQSLRELGLPIPSFP